LKYRDVVCSFGPYFVEPVIAGIDPVTLEPFVANLDLIGCPMIATDFAVSGTCTEQMYGMCESLWVPDMVCRTAVLVICNLRHLCTVFSSAFLVVWLQLRLFRFIGYLKNLCYWSFHAHS